MSDDRTLAAIMALDAAMAQLRAVRVALASTVVQDDPQDVEDDTPKDGCNHDNRTSVVTMGSQVFLCPDCGYQAEEGP